MFWTAGQRVDPTTESTFVWRVKSAGTGSDKVSVMIYTNWVQGEPNYGRNQEVCMLIASGFPTNGMIIIAAACCVPSVK